VDLHHPRGRDRDDLAGNIRREVRKAQRRLQVCEGSDVDRFYTVWAKTFHRQGVAPPDRDRLARIDAACAQRGARTMLFAYDDADRVHAVAYVVRDRRTAYYLMGGGDPQLRTSGASSLLLWEAIRRTGPWSRCSTSKDRCCARSSASSGRSAAVRCRISTSVARHRLRERRWPSARACIGGSAEAEPLSADEL